MSSPRSLCLTLALCSVTIVLGSTHTAWAVTLTPSLFDVSLRRSETVSRELTITNFESIPIRVTLESAHVEFSPEGSINLQSVEKSPPTTLPWWLAYDTGPYTLLPGQTQTIPITITVPDNADPGGHYGGVVVTTLPGTPQKGPTSIALTAKVAALIVATVEGDVKEALLLENFTTNRTWYQQPDVTFHVATNNTGTVHLQPHGVITITNAFTKKVAGDVLVNEDSAYLFPNTSKTLVHSWKAKSPIYFGRYVATLNLTAGHATPVAATASFWILSPVALGSAAGSVVVILLGILALRVYRQRLIRRLDNVQSKK